MKYFDQDPNPELEDKHRPHKSSEKKLQVYMAENAHSNDPMGQTLKSWMYFCAWSSRVK